MKMGEENKIYNVEKEKMPMDGGSCSRNTNGNKNENFRLYPKPLAEYIDVMSERGLFMQTLEKFHLDMKTKFMIPIIGGNDLDLHKLFKEVTSRGGIDKVIGYRRWKEVTASFTFPSTATNASFILRKYYYSLLYHYERLYFLGFEGYNNTADNMPSPLAQYSSRRTQEAMFDSPSLPQKRKIRDEPPLPAVPVTGVIDGKFEQGYLVTVKVGSHTLRGALFHCSDQPFPDSVTIPQPITFNSSLAFTAGTSNPQAGPQYQSVSLSELPSSSAPKQRRRRKRRPSTMDPNHPKPNRSGYNFFFAEQHAILKPQHPGKDRDISRIIGERWNSLSEAEKNVYQERGRVDKQRYQSELAVYKEKQRTEPGLVISDAVPINQRPASGCDYTVEGVDIKVEEGGLALADTNDHDSDLEDTDESDDGDKNEDLDPNKGSESDASIDTPTPVPVKYQSVGDVGPSQQTGADEFELRKREVVSPVAEVESEEADDFHNSMEGGVKVSEHCNNPVEGDMKTGEDPVTMVEDPNNLVEGGVKLDGDANNPVEGDVKMAEALDDTVSGDVKTGEEFNSLAIGDVTMGSEVVSNQLPDVMATEEERDKG